jgi:hypothetical protein
MPDPVSLLSCLEAFVQSLRLDSVIVITIVRVTYLNGSLRSPDPTLSTVNAALCTQVLLHYSLIAATIPCLKPFVISFNTGWGQGSQGKASGYVYRSGHGGSKSNTLTSGSREFPGQHASNAAHKSRKDRKDAADSVSSHESQMMIIRETRAWTVEHESYEMKQYDSRAAGET